MSDPPYQQVANDLEADIRSGRLKSGDRVPSLTTLSQEYGLAKNTIVKAIGILKAKGLVESRQGWGNFVV
jgi:DNA-binding GntR family transcriptional regulator